MKPTERPNSPQRRRSVLAALLALCALSGFLVLPVAPAGAAIAHEFLKPLSDELEKGVPVGCGGQPVPPCIPGPLSGVDALTVDSGHLWVAERIEQGKNLGRSRVDEFDAATGAFLAPQLAEERGVNEMKFAVAVGHAGAEEQVYLSARAERRKHRGGLRAVGEAPARRHMDREERAR